MTYQVLARKWRPHRFEEMVGQEHILRMLKNALDQQRLHHAYLFTGTRGVGKTTLARLFAKCLNCETGITSNPCNACDTCVAIDAGKFLDLLEIDAASRTKVEDTRELLDNVQYTPTQGRYKIYLIDEVHMLSNHSFNALLKTLEEPPAYVKFLLATTDPKRLPVTILSRCLQFNLHHVPADKISQQLAYICTQEKISFEQPALQQIALAADGSMRDALSLLDQAIAFCGDNMTLAETNRMLGSVERDAIYQLLEALAAHDGKQLINALLHLKEQTADFNQLLADVLSTLHQITLAQVIADADVDERIQQFAKRFSAEDIQLYYQIALIGRRDLAYTPDPYQGFEMIMLRMLAFHPVSTTPPSAPALAPLKPSLKKSPQSNWTDIIPQLELSGMALALATHCVMSNLSEHGIELTLASQHESLLNKKLHERIEQAVNRYFNKPMKLTIHIAVQTQETPAQQRSQEQAKQQANATDAIKKDTHVQKMIDLFDATVDVKSIKTIDSVS